MIRVRKKVILYFFTYFRLFRQNNLLTKNAIKTWKSPILSFLCEINHIFLYFKNLFCLSKSPFLFGDNSRVFFVPTRITSWNSWTLWIVFSYPWWWPMAWPLLPPPPLLLLLPTTPAAAAALAAAAAVAPSPPWRSAAAQRSRERSRCLSSQTCKK